MVYTDYKNSGYWVILIRNKNILSFGTIFNLTCRHKYGWKRESKEVILEGLLKVEEMHGTEFRSGIIKETRRPCMRCSLPIHLQFVLAYVYSPQIPPQHQNNPPR